MYSGLWSRSKRALVTLFVSALMFFEISNSSLFAQGFGENDSAYFLPPTFALKSCSGSVECRLKVRFYVDIWASSSAYICKIQASSNATFDTGFVYLMPQSDCPDAYLSAHRYPETNKLGLGAVCQGTGSVLPFDGIAFEYVLRAQRGDTVHVQLASLADIIVGNPIEWWAPHYIDLNRTIIIPDDLVIDAGDCDCSGIISVSDVVYLIQYIFAGGPSPDPLSAADVDNNCIVSISDAVYLINYIFSGGSAPQVGCAD